MFMSGDCAGLLMNTLNSVSCHEIGDKPSSMDWYMVIQEWIAVIREMSSQN